MFYVGYKIICLTFLTPISAEYSAMRLEKYRDHSTINIKPPVIPIIVGFDPIDKIHQIRFRQTVFLDRRFDWASDGIYQNPESTGIKGGGYCPGNTSCPPAMPLAHRYPACQVRCEILFGLMATHTMPVICCLIM
jgi:hypothetical protein